jgi:hypothetical protein
MWTWLRHLWQVLVDAVLRTSAHAAEEAVQQLDVWSQLEADTLNLINAIRDIPKFKFDPKWKSRVINAPRAIEGIQDVYDIVFHGLGEKFAALYQAILTLRASLEGQNFGHFGSVDPQSRLTKIVDYIGALQVALRAFATAYHDLSDIAQTIDDVKRRIETLDDLFLPQSNSRVWITVHERARSRSTQMRAAQNISIDGGSTEGTLRNENVKARAQGNVSNLGAGAKSKKETGRTTKRNAGAP